MADADQLDIANLRCQTDPSGRTERKFMQMSEVNHGIGMLQLRCLRLHILVNEAGGFVEMYADFDWLEEFVKML